MLALALSDVLLVNLWQKDIGRYNGANYGLLKLLFEINLKIFGSSSRKTLCFVIRDFEPEVNQEKMSTELKDDMEKIWSKIFKGEKHKSKSIHDFFDF